MEIARKGPYVRHHVVASLAAAVLGALFPRAAAAAKSGAVEFADPGDPVFRALYPTLDPVTGFTPVAEPAVAAGRSAARPRGQGECDAGFRIAEPVTKEWKHGPEVYLAAHFFVTTDHRPGVNAPCYRPEPWLCVLERAGDSWRPIDCARVRQDLVFPDEPGMDTAPFRLNERETAIGARLRHESATRFESWTDEALILFRLHGRRLTQVLAVPVGRQEEDFTDGSTCSRTLVLQVEETRTNGFFDWRLRGGRTTSRSPCAIEPDPVGLYRWNGAAYVKP